MSDDYKLRADLQAIIGRAGDQPHWNTATDRLVGAYTRADLEAAVRRALEAAAEAAQSEAGHAMEVGASHCALGALRSASAIRALASDPEAIRRIVEGGE